MSDIQSTERDARCAAPAVSGEPGIAQPAFQRTELIAGHGMMRRLADTRVLVVGVGGVGSWCVESLVRTGWGTSP